MVTEVTFLFYLPNISVNIGSGPLCKFFSQLQSSFRDFELHTRSFTSEKGDGQAFSLVLSAKVQNYNGILDEIERALKQYGYNVQSYDDATLDVNAEDIEKASCPY